MRSDCINQLFKKVIRFLPQANKRKGSLDLSLSLSLFFFGVMLILGENRPDFYKISDRNFASDKNRLILLSHFAPNENRVCECSDRFRLDQKPPSPFPSSLHVTHTLSLAFLSSRSRWKVLTKIVSTSSNGIGLY